APAAAAAHPLGNFTINRFSRLEVSGHRIYVRYVLDMAEIPTFQAGHIDTHAYARRIARNAQLVVDGRAAGLVPLGTALAHPLGAAGLHTTRLEVILAGPTLRGKTSVSYRDDNYKDRIGWKEIVVGPTTRSTSDELRAYPKDLLQSPLDITSVSTQLAPTDAPDVPCRGARRNRHGHTHDRRLRTRPRHARALAVHRPRAALPVAEPGFRRARDRDRRSSLSQPLSSSARPRP